MTSAHSDERRRHPRRKLPAGSVQVRTMGQVHTVLAHDVIDVSAAGISLEGLSLGLQASVDVVFVGEDGVSAATVHARVVRVRLAGRRRGQPLPPAVALAFAETDAAALARALQIGTQIGTPEGAPLPASTP